MYVGVRMGCFVITKPMSCSEEICNVLLEHGEASVWEAGICAAKLATLNVTEIANVQLDTSRIAPLPNKTF